MFTCMIFQVIYFQKKSQIGMQITSLAGIGHKKALAGRAGRLHVREYPA